MAAPRLFGIPARDAPVVAVLRRGPSAWCHIGRWSVGATPSYEAGSWLRATVYPQRCDLSPDGRWLAFFALSGRAEWSAGATFLAVSRLPWATALAAWGTGSTWTLGMQFVTDRSVWEVGEPDEGDAAPCRERYGLGFVRNASYAVERRCGWQETADSPPRNPRDPWEIARAPHVTMVTPAPASDTALEVTGAFAAFRSHDTEHYGEPEYRLRSAAGTETLTGVQWAGWAPDGRLLVATTDGRLQVRSGPDIVWETDLAALEPDPAPPPPQARSW